MNTQMDAMLEEVRRLAQDSTDVKMEFTQELQSSEGAMGFRQLRRTKKYLFRLEFSREDS